MSVSSAEQRRSRRAEGALVRRMLDGEEAAFEEFCDDYVPLVYRFARRRLAGDPELVREVVQSTVCKAIASLRTFRGEAALVTWLCACCRNEIASHFRRRAGAIREVDLEADGVGLEAMADPATSDGPEGALLRRERSELVHVALDALPPHYGTALEWKYLDRLSVKEIAARLDLRPKAAESLLTRARVAFRAGYARLAAGVTAAATGIETATRRTAV